MTVNYLEFPENKKRNEEKNSLKKDSESAVDKMSINEEDKTELKKIFSSLIEKIK